MTYTLLVLGVRILKCIANKIKGEFYMKKVYYITEDERLMINVALENFKEQWALIKDVFVQNKAGKELIESLDNTQRILENSLNIK